MEAFSASPQFNIEADCWTFFLFGRPFRQPPPDDHSHSLPPSQPRPRRVEFSIRIGNHLESLLPPRATQIGDPGSHRPPVHHRSPPLLPSKGPSNPSRLLPSTSFPFPDQSPRQPLSRNHGVGRARKDRWTRVPGSTRVGGFQDAIGFRPPRRGDRSTQPDPSWTATLLPRLRPGLRGLRTTQGGRPKKQVVASRDSRVCTRTPRTATHPPTPTHPLPHLPHPLTKG